MKIINILFNYSKSKNDKQILGVERCFIDQAKYLILNGDELFSVTKKGMILADGLKEAGSKFAEVPALGNADIFSMLRLVVIFFFFKPDIAICHSGRALSLVRIARFFAIKKFPIIGFDHGINPKKFLKADYVFTVNSYFSKELIKAGKSPDRAFVIPNMIEVPKNFSPINKVNFRNPIRLGSLGRLYPEKLFDKVVEAMAILRDRGIECEYVIGGIGPMEKGLNELAKKLGLEKNFKILGWTEDKKTFFESIDLFLLPSLGETFGIVLLEAMLYSTPIITSDSWGPDEIIDEGIDGIKVTKADAGQVPTLVADAVERLSKDEGFARSLAVAAYKKFFQNYSAEIVGIKLHQTLKLIYQSWNR